jgi:hypothetical protein
MIAKGEQGQENARVLDQNGNEITVGTVVRLKKERKAYQVPAKGHGRYNDDKEFVPITDGAPRGERNLLLPVGMRGVVTKVYLSDNLSANFPVQVQFSPGEYCEGGYDPPVPFQMHFDLTEVEAI